jgi:hypothetical protein
MRHIKPLMQPDEKHKRTPQAGVEAALKEFIYQ